MPTIPLTRTLARLAQIALVAALCLAFAMAIMPSGDGPGRINDKLLHGLTFFVLGGLSVAAFRHRSAVAMFFALAFFGGLIEIAQWWTDWGRSADMKDMAADLVGAALGLILASLITREA
ncbi:MAG: hypothetical protein GW855_12440 [Erythrobacter sp.]|nr:hypothetical protein [Erythrobacter sp.]NCQ63752.1 hypothetical protein [Alphaproteobacteria bacterium]